jgi:hypothetical protein
MQEMLLDEQLRTQLHLQESPLIQQAQQQTQNRPRPRRVKKSEKKPPINTDVDINESLKNEIEYMPMKTPISILQELLSRRGMFQ